MKAHTLTLPGLALVLLAGCQMNCVDGTGAVEQRTLEISSFTGIEVDGSIHVFMEKGAAQTVTATAPTDLLDLLNTKVKGNTWQISTSKCWRSNQPFIVHITTPGQINAINVQGSGDVTSADVFGSGRTRLAASGSGSIEVTGINEKKLETAISGSGSIKVAGTCSMLDAKISGSGDLVAKELAANEASVKISGSGDATLTAISKLDARVSGSGEVKYAGKPDVSSKVSGSGAVTPLP